MNERLQKLAHSLKTDCAIITNDINRRYLTGMKSSAGAVLIFPEEAYLLVDFRYIEKARETVKDCTVLEMRRLLPLVQELMKKHGAFSISVEAESMTLHQLSLYREGLPDAEFLTDDSLSRTVYDLRTVKTREELSKIKAAQQIAEDALQQLLAMLHTGMTEREIALSLDFNMRKNGAEDLSFETIALTGAHTSMPHGVPDDRPVQEGDFVLMDFGAVVDGYHSDMTRTVCMGHPTEEMAAVYRTVQQAQEAALAQARAGITGHELDYAARSVIRNAGYGEHFGHSLGHGVGMEIHEYPVASENVKKELPEGSVVTVEPGIYLPSKFGVRIEDFVYITKNGCENLTGFTNNLICL